MRLERPWNRELARKQFSSVKKLTDGTTLACAFLFVKHRHTLIPGWPSLFSIKTIISAQANPCKAGYCLTKHQSETRPIKFLYAQHDIPGWSRIQECRVLRRRQNFLCYTLA